MSSQDRLRLLIYLLVELKLFEYWREFMNEVIAGSKLEDVKVLALFQNLKKWSN